MVVGGEFPRFLFVLDPRPWVVFDGGLYFILVTVPIDTYLVGWTYTRTPEKLGGWIYIVSFS